MKKRIQAFGHAFRGIAIGFRREVHMRIHFVLAFVALTAAWFFQISKMEWIAVLLCIAMVFAAEMLNAAVEHLANRVNREYDPEIGAVKDIAAGAVLIAALFALTVGCIIYLPYLWDYLT
ncbi:MAG: diacylglycerol kinase family protein [Bacteroidetes bacterium]|nr:diacylglycerol kinase family protein [Bacteroidota bacterium]